MSETLMPDGSNIIPPAVRRAAQRAEELSRQASQVAKEPPGDATTVELRPPPRRAAPEQQEPEQQQGSEQPGQSEQQQGQPEQQQGQPAQPVRDAAYWEHRARTLEGKYNAEVPTLRAQQRALEGQLSVLQNTIATMNMRQAEAPPPPPPAGGNDGISPEDVESYGQEFIDKVKAWTRGETSAEIRRLNQEIERLRGQTQTASSKVTQAQVMSGLDQSVPGWRETNDDPLFLEWLNQSDPFSGQIRMAMLKEAYTSGDVSRTANFFLAFRREQTATQGGAGSPPAHTPNGAGTVPLETLAAPGRGRPANPGAPAEKRIWTNAQIAAFYRDCAAGKYARQEDARRRIEADIFAAGSEGRIRS